MPFPSGSCLSGLFQAQFVHLEDNVYSLYDFGKAGVGLGVVLVASSVQNGVVAGIDVEFGSLAGKAQCVLFVGVLGRVFQKGQTTGTDGIKVVVTGIARLVHDGRGRNDVINAVVVPKDGPVPQAQRYLIQKSLDGVGHQRQWSHLHHKRTAFQRTRKLHREPNPMRTRTVPLQSNDESERERGKFLVSVVWRWCVCASRQQKEERFFLLSNHLSPAFFLQVAFDAAGFGRNDWTSVCQFNVGKYRRGWCRQFPGGSRRRTLLLMDQSVVQGTPSKGMLH